MFLEVIFYFVSAVIGGSLVAIVQNHPYIIAKKTRAEAIQKLKLDSMIDVINGTEELISAVTNLAFIIIKLARITRVKTLNNNEEIIRIISEAKLEFKESAKGTEDTINKFIFSLKRDMIINTEDEEVRKEIKNLKTMHVMMRGSIMGLNEVEIKNKKDNNILIEIFNGLDKIGGVETINQYVERILKIYKAKLDKEQEDWLDKLLNCFKRR